MAHDPSVQNCTLPPPVRDVEESMVTADCPECGTTYLLVRATRGGDDVPSERWMDAEKYWASFREDRSDNYYEPIEFPFPKQSNKIRFPRLFGSGEIFLPDPEDA